RCSGTGRRRAAWGSRDARCCGASSRWSGPWIARSWCTARRSRAVLPGDCSGRRRPVSIPSVTSLLLAQDFPPMGGGIARLHGEMARHFPRGELVVSTPLDSDAPDVDAQFAAAVDRLPVSRGRTKTLPGLLLWSRRAASLARQHRLRVVHLGTDPARFRPRVDSTELRRRLELPDGASGARWLLTVARLEPHKGVDTVLQALPAILERAPDVRYAVAGAGAVAEREKLEQLARTLGVAERVHLLGEVSERDLPALYALAAVYVGASRRAERIGVEGLGIS